MVVSKTEITTTVSILEIVAKFQNVNGKYRFYFDKTAILIK